MIVESFKETGGERDIILVLGRLPQLTSFPVVVPSLWYWLAVAYGDVKLRLLALRVFWVAVIPTFVRYEAFPLPIALNPNVSTDAFFYFALAYYAAGGLCDVTVFRFQWELDCTELA